jgi:hypothetical protein
LDNPEPLFVAAPAVVDWLRQHVIAPDGALHNPDHAHLEHAKLGVLWTNVQNARHQRRVIGQAEIFRPQGGAWQKARATQQIVEWFGDVPDFIIILDACWCSAAGDVEFAMLVEHECYHCAQALDDFGMPAFYKETGLPKFTMRGHDVEEFVGVVRRYGAGCQDSPLRQLAAAVYADPEVSAADIARACGTCMN